MTANVLNQLGAGKKEAPPAAEAENPEQFLNTIAEIVDRARAEGRSSAYIGDLISEASRDGRIAVPEGLRTADGKVDTATVLSIIVARAASKEDAYSNALVAEANGVRKASAEPTPTDAGDPRVHVVVAGESLAAIALQYYNDALQYPRILAANSDQIRRADLILIGQRLVIPR